MPGRTHLEVSNTTLSANKFFGMATHPQGIQSTERSLCQSQAYICRFPSNSDIPQTFIKFTVPQYVVDIMPRRPDASTRHSNPIVPPSCGCWSTWRQWDGLWPDHLQRRGY